MRHLVRARMLLVSPLAFVACSTTQTDAFRALPKPAIPTAPASKPFELERTEVARLTETFEAKPSLSTGRVGPGPNVGVERVTKDALRARPGALLRIVAVLPDPTGPDAPNERVRIQSAFATAVPADWRIVDSSGSYWLLTTADGAVPAAREIEVVRTDPPMLLNNEGGDEVTLIAPSGTEVERRPYASAVQGEWTTF